MVIIEDTGGPATAKTAKAVRSLGADVPIVLVTSNGEESAGAGGLFDDLLVEPFSPSYARARLRAALLRRACRWQRAGKPADEPRRIAALRALNLLDTPREERFDRITRLAAAFFDTPVALISLIDENRQWLKSACGVETTETSRDESFCAHVVVSREPLIIPDALLDPRFAENPLVSTRRGSASMRAFR